jgi:hypothetical protein
METPAQPFAREEVVHVARYLLKDDLVAQFSHFLPLEAP